MYFAIQNIIIFVAYLENQFTIFTFHPAFLQRKKSQNIHSSLYSYFKESSMRIDLSVYFDSQTDVESHYSKYGQSTGNLYITKKTWEMQALGPHPRPTKKNLYFNKISSDLHAQEDLSSANVEECFFTHPTINNPWGQIELL